MSSISDKTWWGGRGSPCREKRGRRWSFSLNEMLNPDGTVYRENLHAGKMGKAQSQTVRYTLRGGGVETYEPHFTLSGPDMWR